MGRPARSGAWATKNPDNLVEYDQSSADGIISTGAGATGESAATRCRLRLADIRTANGKHGQQQQTVRLRNAWIDVDPRNWKTRNDMTINVGLGSGGKAQQFAQVMALANIQEKLISGGKGNLVGDPQLYNTAAEITRIMGHKNPDKFFNDPSAINPQTGQLLHPPAPPPSPPPDPKLLQIQAKAQMDQATAAHQAQIDQQKAQNDAVHQQIKAQTEIGLAKIKAELDARLAVLDAHLKAATEGQKMRRRQPPGARQAQDGHHYVADPKRPGKFLLVVHHA